MPSTIDTTSPHYKGAFRNIYDVNHSYPNGGTDGDYVDIDGWAHYWNADRGTWCVNKERDAYWDELLTGLNSGDLVYLDIINSGDGFLAWGESCNIICKVMKGFMDLTNTVTVWTITRNSGDPADDAAWNQSDKAKNFNGEITLAFTSIENDIGVNANVYTTRFTITAKGNDGIMASGEITV